MVRTPPGLPRVQNAAECSLNVHPIAPGSGVGDRGLSGWPVGQRKRLVWVRWCGVRAAGALACAALFAGCGSGDTVVLGEPSISASPEPTVSISARPWPTPVRLTAEDSGRTVQVRRGEALRVELAPDLGSYRQVRSDQSDVLQRTSVRGGYPEDTPSVAEFAALAPGRARLSSVTDAHCLHATPRCMIPQRAFDVLVIVDGARPGGVDSG